MDFYVILGVGQDASLSVLKRAYKRLARRYHPDINPGDREAAAFFRRATEAYETLSDSERRHHYDTHGATLAAVENTSVEFHGFDFSGQIVDASATFGELFSEVLPGKNETLEAQSDRGGDLYGEIALSFEESLKGTERKLSLTRLDACEVCEGAGIRRGPETRCVHCYGVGAKRWHRGHMVFSKSCEHCGGSGRQRHRPCEACRTEGTVAKTEEITIQVPAGVMDGSRMRVAGKGNVGRHDGPSGDLYITAKVSTHSLFKRVGDDLCLQVPIAVHEAALGAKIQVPTLDEPVFLRIPAGTQSGQRFRVRFCGIPSPRTEDRGDLLVEVSVVIPPLQDKRSKELLREFGNLNKHDIRRDLFNR
jgi:molecular chaperone DnaJ